MCHIKFWIYLALTKILIQFFFNYDILNIFQITSTTCFTSSFEDVHLPQLWRHYQVISLNKLINNTNPFGTGVKQYAPFRESENVKCKLPYCKKLSPIMRCNFRVQKFTDQGKRYSANSARQKLIGWSRCLSS